MTGVAAVAVRSLRRYEPDQVLRDSAVPISANVAPLGRGDGVPPAQEVNQFGFAVGVSVSAS